MLKSASSNEFDLVASKVAMDSNNVVDQLMAFPSSENLNSFGAFNEGLEEGMEDLNAVAQENTGRESTGRWTREEHMLFIKGLEMYGKGWKKIAGLIKTRTVVQIRTHAQKYFLKLSKARQNGEHGGGHGRSLMDGFRRKKYKRSERPLALCPLLKNYFTRPESAVSLASSARTDSDDFSTSSPGGGSIQLPGTGNSSSSNTVVSGSSGIKTEGDDSASDAGSTTTGGTEPPSASTNRPPSMQGPLSGNALLDTESGLYNFLSPVLAAEVPGSGTTLFNTSNMNEMNAVAGQVPPPPSWYKLGLTIQNLLTEAEHINWTEDMGEYVTGEVAATNTAFMGQPALFNAYMNSHQQNGQTPMHAAYNGNPNGYTGHPNGLSNGAMAGAMANGMNGNNSQSNHDNMTMTGPMPHHPNQMLTGSNSTIDTAEARAHSSMSTNTYQYSSSVGGYSNSVATFVESNASLSNTALYSASLNKMYPGDTDTNANNGPLKRTRMTPAGSHMGRVDNSMFSDQTSLQYLRWRSQQLDKK